MQRFSVVKADPTSSHNMQIMQNWVHKFICVVKPKQLVVGNRVDHVCNLPVTPEQFDAKDRAAHVCPFVQTSLDRDQYWMEESNLTNDDRDAIQSLLLKQMGDFLTTEPAHDPMATGSPLPAPQGVIYKTFMTIFPRVLHFRGKFPLFDTIHQNLKPIFMERGLMLGQFYNGCPFEEGAIYAPEFKSIILSSPTPSYAIRYMVSQDHIFNLHPEAAEWIKDAHRRYFP